MLQEEKTKTRRKMENSPKQDTQTNPHSHSSNCSTTSSSNSTTANNNNNGFHAAGHGGGNNQPTQLPSPKPITTRSDSTNPYPTTFVQADTSSFKQVVQMLTGSPKPTAAAISAAAAAHHDPSPKSHTHHNIPPIKSIPKKTQPSSGFKLYERRNSLKNLKINPLNPIFSTQCPGFSPRKPEILSPSILDFPALVLSPVTPLIPDPFDRSGPNPAYANCFGHPFNNNSNHFANGSSYIGRVSEAEAEEKGIKERGFYLHPSPATTPREAELPRLLPLFPVTSPRVSGSGNPSS